MKDNCATPDTLGAYIRQARQAAGLSANRLAAKAGVATSNISRLERGETATPTVELLKRISDALGLDLAQMLAYQGVRFKDRAPSGGLAAYLRHRHLPDDAIAEAEAEIERIARKYQHRNQIDAPDSDYHQPTSEIADFQR